MGHAAAVVPSVGDVDPARWQDEFDAMFAGVLAPAFGRREPRLRARSYVLGLASGLERKNGWTLAEYAGDAVPDGMQRLLNAAVWDQDAVRGALDRYVAARLGDPDAVLIGDETGLRSPGSILQGCNGSTPAPRGRSRTARSGCSWCTRSRRRAPGFSLTASCTCRSRGRRTWTGAPRLGCRRMRCSRRSRSWRA
jgi:hypothetical protein